jgi:LmbE family N-acetylglucosaminyl deacetylase
MVFGSGPALVIAPHPDDEVLGVGGTIARLAGEGRDVFVVITTKGGPPLFDEAFIERGRREALEAHEALGVRKTIFLEGFPAALLDTVPLSALNAALLEVVDETSPEILFIPFPGDLHVDHRKVAEAALVVARPNRDHGIRSVLAYEVLSETNWNAGVSPAFQPNTYVDISSHMATKLAAMERFRSQLKAFPHERSLEAIESLGRTRGAAAGCRSAEAFVLLRQILR